MRLLRLPVHRNKKTESSSPPPPHLNYNIELQELQYYHLENILIHTHTHTHTLHNQSSFKRRISKGELHLALCSAIRWLLRGGMYEDNSMSS